MVTCSSPWCDVKGGVDKSGLCKTCRGWKKHHPDPPNLTSLSSFPSAALTGVELDSAAIDSVCADFKSGDEIKEDDFKRAMFGMMANVFQTVNKQETELIAVKLDVKDHSDRLKSLEDKVGDRKDCAVPLSITMQNLPKVEHGDESAVKSVIREINAEGIDAESDVIKVVRKGYKPANATQSERLGTVLVELKSTEVKAKIMKAKSILATNERLKNVRISNMKTQTQANQDFFNRQLLRMVPGGQDCYISRTGAILSKTRPPPQSHQGWRGQSQGPPSTQRPGQYQVRRPPVLHGQFQHHPGGHGVGLPQPNQVVGLLMDPAGPFSQPPPSSAVNNTDNC